MLFEGVRAGVLAGVTFISSAETFANNQTWIGPESSASSTGQAGKAQSEKSKGQESKEEKYLWKIGETTADIIITEKDGGRTHLHVFCKRTTKNNVDSYHIIISDNKGEYTGFLTIDIEAGEYKVNSFAQRGSRITSVHELEHTGGFIYNTETDRASFSPESSAALRVLSNQDRKFAILNHQEVKKYIW